MEKEKELTQENEVTAIEKVRIFTSKHNLECHIVQDANILTIQFSKVPSADIVSQIRELLFFTNEIVVNNIDSLFEDNGQTVMINLVEYTRFVKFYVTLKEFQAHVCTAEITEKYLQFSYTLSHKRELNSIELDVLQNIVNPNIAYHDSIRVSYCKGVSTLWADLKKEKAHLD